MIKTNFENTLEQIKQMIDAREENLLFKVCNILKNNIYHYDWVGFYILKGEILELGTYIGKPTEHTQIAIGKGICGQVAESKQTMVVQDVNKEDNYIACSIDVQSEIVVPILKEGRFVAELDIDSHSPAPFHPADIEFLESICGLLSSEF